MAVIYGLYHQNELFYVGQTIDYAARIAVHKCNMKIKGFVPDIIEICEDSKALEREKYHIKEAVKKGCNLINIQHTTNGRLDKIDIQILKLLAEDKKHKEMEAVVSLSCRTIETRVQKIKRKLNVKTIGGLVYKAIQLGLIL